MQNIIIIGILLLCVGLAGFSIYKAKKKGKRCIGCPDGGTCPKAGCCCDDVAKRE